MSGHFKLIAGGLSLFLATLTSLLAFILLELTTYQFLISFAITFLLSWILIYLAFEFMIIKEIKKIQELISPLLQETQETDTESTFSNPVRKITHDVDEYAKIREKEIYELKKGAAFRREFIANISHELKTPLFAAQGFVHTLIDGAVRDKRVRERFLKKAAKNLDGLDDLVQDLLSLSQIETGEVKLHYENFDLLTLTQEVFEQFESRSQKKEVSLEIAPAKVGKPKRKMTVQGDPRLIYQVLSNLVSNGIKFSEVSGRVIVDFRESDEDITVLVRDYGIGIKTEHLPRIFERFYRVEKSRSKVKDKGGTGLGLAIVKHILEAHNSQIQVKSKPGQGSTFSFKLNKPGWH